MWPITNVSTFKNFLNPCAIVALVYRSLIAAKISSKEVKQKSVDCQKLARRAVAISGITNLFCLWKCQEKVVIESMVVVIVVKKNIISGDDGFVGC